MSTSKPSLRIVVDALGLPRVGGARRLVVSLLAEVARIDSRNDYTVFMSRPEPELSGIAHLRLRYIPIKNRMMTRLWAQAVLPISLRVNRADVFHSLKNIGIFGVPCHYALTVFDMTHVKLAKLYPAVDGIYWRHVLPRLMQRSFGIMTISETVAKDIALQYHIAREHIKVIYPGLTDHFRRSATAEERSIVRGRYQLPQRIILYVGGLGRHKNLPTLIRAFAKLKDAAGCGLVLVGDAHHSTSDTELPNLIAALGLSGKVKLLGDVSDVDLRALYASSDLFVMPSLSEGFGLALVEAMGQGCPVLGARAGSIPEVCGDAALFVDDPLDADEWATKMRTLLQMPQTVASMRERGWSRASQFSWTTSARQLISWYGTMECAS